MNNHSAIDRQGREYVRDKTESLFPLRKEFDPLPMPLIIEHAGYSNWGPTISSGRTRNPLFAIELVTAGNLLLVQDGRELLVEKETVFFLKLRSAVTYRTGPAGYVHKRFVALSGPFLEILLEHFDLTTPDILQVANPARLSVLIKKACALLCDPDFRSVDELSSLAYRILVYLSRNRIRSMVPPPLQAALSFMSRSMNRTLSARQIAGSVSMSVAHFYRLFQSHFKLSPVRYHTRMKMEWACQQLAFTSIPVKQIAYDCNYTDTAYFSNVFKKLIGLSPRAYRRRNQGSD
jgi:AraC-like DNA-binding protein